MTIVQTLAHGSDLEIAGAAPVTSLLEHSLDDLTDYLAKFGQPKFRAKQIWEWIYKHHVDSFHEMENIPQRAACSA